VEAGVAVVLVLVKVRKEDEAVVAVVMKTMIKLRD